jgi:hypothetical protein
MQAWPPGWSNEPEFREGIFDMKAHVEERLRKLEEKSVYRIVTLADFVLLRAKRERGYPVPEIVEWDPEFEKMWKEAFSKDKKKS